MAHLCKRLPQVVYSCKLDLFFLKVAYDNIVLTKVIAEILEQGDITENE